MVRDVSDFIFYHLTFWFGVFLSPYFKGKIHVHDNQFLLDNRQELTGNNHYLLSVTFYLLFIAALFKFDIFEY